MRKFILTIFVFAGAFPATIARAEEPMASCDELAKVQQCCSAEAAAARFSAIETSTTAEIMTAKAGMPHLTGSRPPLAKICERRLGFAGLTELNCTPMEARDGVRQRA